MLDLLMLMPFAPAPRPAPLRPALRLSMPGEQLLARRLEALGLRGLAGLRLTNNRTVMVCLTASRVLSIHRCYAQAPDRVLKAVVRFLAPRTPRVTRRAAQHEILGFTAFRHAATAAGPRRPDRPRPGDLEKTERLARLFRAFNAQHFGGSLPDVPLCLSGRMRSRLGQLCIEPATGAPYEITISRRHIDRHGWDEAAHTLLHEMVHLWQHAEGMPVDHGPRFRAKADAVGVTPSARRSVRTASSRSRAARYD